MPHRLKSLSLATATLLLSLFTPLLPLTLKFESPIVQAQTTQDQNKDLSVVSGSRGEAAGIEVISTRTGLPLEVSNNLSHPYYWAPFILIGNGL